jgi:hypothetical protein
VEPVRVFETSVGFTALQSNRLRYSSLSWGKPQISLLRFSTDVAGALLTLHLHGFLVAIRKIERDNKP